MARTPLRLKVAHVTRYEYEEGSEENHNELKLMPLSDEWQTCLQFRLQVTPDVRMHSFDQPGGRLHYFSIRPAHRELTIRMEATVLTFPREPWNDLSGEAVGFDGGGEERHRREYAEYLTATRYVPFIPDVLPLGLESRKRTGGRPLPFLLDLTKRIHRWVAYAPGATHVDTPLAEVMKERRGVCQDMTHLMLSILRQAGFPARYVSGYLYTGKDGGAGGHKMVGGDAMHAWVEALLPDGQWYGFDPTNNRRADEAYVRVHVGRDYSDVVPVKGVFRGPKAGKLSVDVAVARIG